MIKGQFVRFILLMKHKLKEDMNTELKTYFKKPLDFSGNSVTKEEKGGMTIFLSLDTWNHGANTMSYVRET